MQRKTPPPDACDSGFAPEHPDNDGRVTSWRLALGKQAMASLWRARARLCVVA